MSCIFRLALGRIILVRLLTFPSCTSAFNCFFLAVLACACGRLHERAPCLNVSVLPPSEIMEILQGRILILFSYIGCWFVSLSLCVCLIVWVCKSFLLTSYANLITRTSHSSTASSNCVSTSPTRNFSSSSTITCSCWNRRNTRERESSGPSLILAWTCKLALI